MNLFNKFSMLKKPYLSYIFELVAGDNCVFIINNIFDNSANFSERFWLFHFCLFQLTLYLHTEK